MNPEPPRDTTQSQLIPDNVSPPQPANEAQSTVDSDPLDTMSTDSQRTTADPAALRGSSGGDTNQGVTDPNIPTELIPSTFKDTEDTLLQDETETRTSNDARSTLESYTSEVRDQAENQGPQTNSSAPRDFKDSVHNGDNAIHPTVERGDHSNGSVDKEYPKIKTQISDENSILTKVPKLADIGSAAVIVIEGNDGAVPHLNTDQTNPTLARINSVQRLPNENLLESSQSPSADYENPLGAGRSIRNLFQRGTSDPAAPGFSRSGSHEPGNEDRTGDAFAGDQLEGDVVLVTGGCGFLGQHIVKLLHLRAPHVAEIRVLDLTYFEKRLDYQPTKRFESLVGDISNSEFVDKALKGVDSVIHVAGVVSWGTFPDLDGMEKVNVKGTLNVVKACLKNNVQRLIYCSTVDVAVGNTSIRDGTEENTPVPDKFLFPGYPETKYHGERIVLGVGQYKKDDGGSLQTTILRPNVLYGELDKYYVTNALRMAHQSMGILYKIGNGKAMFQQAYVGNAAWGFVCAETAMKANPELTKQIFYIPDNTPVQNSFNFLVPYLEAHGMKLSSGYLSYPLSHSAVAAAEIFAKAVSPLVKLNLPVQSCTIAYINMDLHFSGNKAKEMLNYEPIYTTNEAREMSMKFYANIDLEGGKPKRR